MTPVLSNRALNRALLARQGLLARTSWSVEEALEHLVGMQAQAPLSPYVGLWSRIEAFRPEPLAERLIDRSVVRAMAMLRTTIHMHTAADALAIRPVLQPVMERTFRSSAFARQIDGLDLAEVVAAGRALVEGRPVTIAEVGRSLGARWPDRDPVALAYAVRYLVPLVQVPPRGIWGRTGSPRVTTMSSWLGRPLEPAAPAVVEALIRRYLAAFGPASVADISTWSWLTGLGEVVDGYRRKLVTYRAEDGRELLDVPEAPVPDGDQPAPVRFLPEYDNVLLSHADRRRVIPAGRAVPLPPGNGASVGTFLVDGFLRGTWRLRRGRPSDADAIEVSPYATLSAGEAADVEREASALAAFLVPERTDLVIRFEVG